ncbi:MAG: cysteine desulfurase family protein [Acidimicrobiales bacterium]
MIVERATSRARPVHPGLPRDPIYLDYNATTPVDPRVAEAVADVLTREFGNPSSQHAYGRSARALLDAARARVVELVSAPAGRLVFTGSGSEADALAIRGLVRERLLAHGPSHVITQATEHPAVLEACDALRQELGVAVTVLGVDRDGVVDPAEVTDAIRDETVLVSIMHANNETGTIQPVEEIAQLAHQQGVLVHCDAAQSLGKIPVDVEMLGVDLLTIVGHKMYAPKGAGALWIRDGVTLAPLIAGGGQEWGLRAGTENVASLVGLGRAAELAHEALAEGESDRLRELRDSLWRALVDRLGDRILLNGHAQTRLPNTLNVSIDGLRAVDLLERTALIAASTGSACHAGDDAPSPVLVAMGASHDRAMAAIRLSLGRWSTAEDVERAAAAIASAAARS